MANQGWTANYEALQMGSLGHYRREMCPFIITSQGAKTGPPRPLCQSCHLMLLPARNSPAGHPLPCYFDPCSTVTCYISIVHIFKYNSTFLVKVLAMPYPLCTYTLRVLYACGWEFVPSVYFLWINGMVFPPLLNNEVHGSQNTHVKKSVFKR